MEHSEEAVLRHHCQVGAAWREGELVDAAAVDADEPPVEWVPCGLGAAGVYGVSVALLEQLVVGGGGAAGQLLIVHIQLARSVRRYE